MWADTAQAADDARAERLRLESALVGYRLQFLQVRDPQVEHALFPPMIEIYWRLCSESPRRLPPIQAAFARTIVDLLPSLPPLAVEARARRTYPSFVRQHHFELVLRERFDMVLRGHALDLSGLDFLVIEASFAFGVGLSVNTSAGHAWAERKRQRHRPIPLPILDLYLDLDGYKVGQFTLHHPDQVEEAEAFMERERRRVLTWIG